MKSYKRTTHNKEDIWENVCVTLIVHVYCATDHNALSHEEKSGTWTIDKETKWERDPYSVSDYRDDCSTRVTLSIKQNLSGMLLTTYRYQAISALCIREKNRIN